MVSVEGSCDACKEKARRSKRSKAKKEDDDKAQYKISDKRRNAEIHGSKDKTNSSLTKGKRQEVESSSPSDGEELDDKFDKQAILPHQMGDATPQSLPSAPDPPWGSGPFLPPKATMPAQGFVPAGRGPVISSHKR
ncbi:hypothetical protein C1H76_3877 [Elsinoe australis]|uniref:Uncharacterized protein n=1 Tax=Elsinoe australis TaxID=40998 RepID=A0A4U7AZT1_9PEZI|nr:hypothetical protein C1H76_3877 [Elsinoe australis]